MTSDILGHPDRALSWYGLVRQLSGPPGDVEGHIGDCLVKLCEDERAQRAYGRADELQPDRYQGLIGICHLRLLQGDFAGARELCRRLTHDGLNEGQQIAAQIEFFARKFDVAEKLYGELLRKDKDGGGTFHGALTYQSALGRAKQAIGDRPGGNELLKSCLMKETAAAEHEPTNPEAFYRLAAVEASLGMSDSSLQHLHKATNSGWLDYRSLARDPRFDSLRQNADFQAIIEDLATKVAAMRLSLQGFTNIAQY